MKINLAHLRERAAAGGWIDFAVFDARPTAGGDQARGQLLAQLTARARASGLNVDQSALAYQEGSRVQFYGTPSLVKYLSNLGVPRWTHEIEV